MTTWQYLLLGAAALAMLAALVFSAAAKHAAAKQRDFTRSLETLLQPKETVRVICPQRKGRCILTSHRLLFEKKGRFAALPLSAITKTQGQNEKGNRTTVPGNMVKLTITADREYILKNTCPEFSDLVSQLSEKIKKQKEKKKAPKSKT